MCYYLPFYSCHIEGLKKDHCQQVCVLDGEGNRSAFRGRTAEPPQLSRTGSRHARSSEGVYAVPLTIFNRFFLTELNGLIRTN
jgi:hypothetical protein